MLISKILGSKILQIMEALDEPEGFLIMRVRVEKEVKESGREEIDEEKEERAERSREKKEREKRGREEEQAKEVEEKQKKRGGKDRK